MAIIAFAVAPAINTVYRPVIKDCGTSVASAEAFIIHASLAQFLAEIDHDRAFAESRSDYHCCTSFFATTGKKVTGDSLLIMVLHETQHVIADVFDRPPALCDGIGIGVTASNSTQSIIKTYLVVEIVEATLMDVFAVAVRAIDLSDELDARILLAYLLRGITPELSGYHFCHITAECIHTC